MIACYSSNLSKWHQVLSASPSLILSPLLSQPLTASLVDNAACLFVYRYVSESFNFSGGLSQMGNVEYEYT